MIAVPPLLWKNVRTLEIVIRRAGQPECQDSLVANIAAYLAKTRMGLGFAVLSIIGSSISVTLFTAFTLFHQKTHRVLAGYETFQRFLILHLGIMDLLTQDSEEDTARSQRHGRTPVPPLIKVKLADAGMYFVE